MITYIFSILSYFTNIINAKDIKEKTNVVKNNHVELKNLYKTDEKVESFREIRIDMEFEDCKYCRQVFFFFEKKFELNIRFFTKVITL
ncbi:hypothetical protein GLOIN_2v1710613 [Rhizophagus clarus]|uniref:Uncharacterized protein n=1 Tax=Rhizophagus clarus TaxID=94130 RepID=A0A8H3QHP3_9GLOM|nr:hypothetical protein GLOIN_2v1710613 [Rhizophagus clarus]